MPKIELPITNGAYKSRSLPISSQECVNFYVHVNKTGLAKESLFGTPGLTQLATSGINDQSNRGSHVKNGIPYFVNGDTLYKLTRIIAVDGSESFSLDSLGTISGTGLVSMADNGTQLCILVPGGSGYIYNEDAGTPFQTITDPDFTANGNPQRVEFIGGYFLFSTDSKKFIISNLNDGLAYTATDFASAEADPDDIVAPVSVNNSLYICGSETIEPFYNPPTTGAGFPFVRVTGGSIGVGVLAGFSIVKVSGTFFFIGGSPNESPSVYMFSGGQVDIVSDDGINTILEGLDETQLSNVFGWSYSENGARFIGWTLTDTTIVYDLTSGKWHERKSLLITDGTPRQTRWRVNSVVKGYARILCGDDIDGRVGVVDLDTYDEYGENIISTVSTIPFSNLGNSFKVASLELTTESGVGNDADPNPVVGMERSLDARTWSDRMDRPLGKKGEYNKRQEWRRLGRAERFETFRFSVSDKVNKVFIKLEGNIL